MAAHGPLLNAAVKINSTDLSGLMLDVTVNMSAADVDITAMGAAGIARKPGLRDASFEITFNSEFGAASVISTLVPLYTAGSAFLVEVWPNGTSTSATNPKFSGTCIVTDLSPFGGAVGDRAETSITLPVSGVITYATV